MANTTGDGSRRFPRGSRAHALILMLAAVAACGPDETDENLVARVDGYRLTVDQAVELLVDEERLAADVGVVRSLAELWIDYTLLADEAAQDTLFEGLDLSPLVMQQVSQGMVFQLRDSVIQADTFITDDELRRRYEAEPSQLEVRARHIMLQLPIGATPAQTDSVREVLGALRERIAGGESFEAVAMQYSQDPGSAGSGGDLGYFRQGDMVAPFEQAAFGLETGTVSDVVRTPMGLHLIRVDDRRTRDFDQAARQYRAQTQSRLVQEAESVFVSALVDRAVPTITPGAQDVTRGLAESPGAGISGRAGRRNLVEWDGGAITVADVRELLQIESPALRAQIAAGSDEEVDEFLESLARRDLLIREAEAAGLRPPQDSIDALVDGARTQLRQAARMLGLLDLDQAPGEAREIAVARATENALQGNLSGATQVVPLGMVTYQLREGHSSALLETGVGRVIVEVARIRAARSLSPAEEGVDPGTPADTTGR